MGTARPKRNRRRGILLFFVLIAGLLFWLHTSYPLPYVYRTIVWQDADYYDFEKLPSRSIPKSENPSYFEVLDQQKATAETFEQLPQVDQLESFLEATQTNGFVVIKGGNILYEGYFNGNTRDHVQSSFSVAKSILSALVGIALDEQYINSIDDPITRYLPELMDRDSRFARITIEHVLKMRSGLDYSNEVTFPFVNADPPLVYYHSDLRSVALTESQIVAEPDSVFRYNNYNALLIGLILERATGRTVSDYFGEKIWQPIGAEYDASWSMDYSGFEKMESGFNARPIDFAKLGLLFLNKGQWGDRQLIPADWVQVSTQLDRDTQDRDQYNARRWFYRYFWWGIPRTDGEDDFIAIGRFGQYIFVSPTNNVVMVRNGPRGNDFEDRDWTELFHMVADQF